MNKLKDRTNALISIKNNVNYRIEQYLKNPKKCSFCKSVLNYKDKHKKFCNSSCSAKETNKLKKGQKRNFSKEAINNIRNSKIKSLFLKYEKKFTDKIEEIKQTGQDITNLKNLEDIYFLNPNYCRVCNIILVYNLKNKKTCTQICYRKLLSNRAIERLKKQKID